MLTESDLVALLGILNDDVRPLLCSAPARAPLVSVLLSSGGDYVWAGAGAVGLGCRGRADGRSLGSLVGFVLTGAPLARRIRSRLS